MRIPIFVGEAHIGFIRDEGTLRRYAAAPNVELVGHHCHGSHVEAMNVKRVNLTPRCEGADDGGHGIGPNSMLPVYAEEMASSHPLAMLKRVDEHGEFRRWSDTDGFNPRRFNPDQVPAPLMRRA